MINPIRNIDEDTKRKAAEILLIIGMFAVFYLLLWITP